ncbi:MAG TPA: TauD/TfdA family dioxygenase [Gammaproteobacteria bacterium]|nr:TauD/TfdA family dioxygenase [Gammaproteobacteria bacterium]
METAATRTRAIEILPSGDALGAEVRGVDIASGLSDVEVEQIKAAWREHLVLVFRGQSIDDHQLIAFTQRFGELDPPGPNPYGGPIYPEHPELNIISNIVEDGRPIGNLGAGEAVWHADMTYLDEPPKGAVLYAVELPAAGGDTQFANMFAAYEALPQDTRREIEGLRAIHDAAHNSAGMLRKGYEEVDDVRNTPGARQPLVRTDPETGRRCLFLGRRPRSYVVGLEVEESEALLDRLWAHATEDRFVTTHGWRVGDLLIWDNHAVLHRRDGFDPEARRRLHRAQLMGDGPIS